jgi:hypothetical protein
MNISSHSKVARSKSGGIDRKHKKNDSTHPQSEKSQTRRKGRPYKVIPIHLV